LLNGVHYRLYVLTIIIMNLKKIFIILIAVLFSIFGHTILESIGLKFSEISYGAVNNNTLEDNRGHITGFSSVEHNANKNLMITYYPSGGMQETWDPENQVKINYYKSGGVRSIVHYKDGKLNGILRKYYENGNVQLEYSYKNDIRHGTVKEYGKNGKLILEENFKDGYFDGPYKEYYDNGSLKREGLNRNNNVVSEKYYNEEGILIFERKY